MLCFILSTGSVGADDYSVCTDEKAVAANRIKACSNLIRRKSEHNEVLIAYFNRVELYERDGKRDLAIKDCDAAIGFAPSNPMVESFYNTRLDLYLKNRNYAGAIASLTAAIEKKVKYPSVSDLYSKRASVWSLNDNLDRAIADQTEAIRLDPTDASRYTTRAAMWYKRNDVDRALEDHNEAIRRDPKAARPYFYRGAYWAERGDNKRAMADYSEAIRIEPSNSAAYGVRALRWRDLGEYDRALADYDEAIRLSPKGSGFWAFRGEIWRLKGDLDRALKDQDVGLTLAERSDLKGLIRILRADTLRYRGDLRSALADYETALQEHPPVAIPVATGKGLTYEKMGDFARARDEFSAAVKAGSGRTLVDIYKSSFDTAQARIAALDSGAVQPTILTAPPTVKSEQSIPTSTIAVSTPPQSVAPDRPLPTAHQGRRVALVVGNAAYRNVDPLLNPHKDAKAVADLLRNVGFEVVTLANDQTREQMINALRSFANEAEKSDWALVYYAGHGIEVGGVNYLVPVDATIAVDRDIQFEAVPLSQVLNAADAAKKIKLVVLDACRNNPFKPRQTAAPEVVAASMSTGGAPITTRSVNGRGLAEVKVTGATLVVYAAKDGQVALDGEGGNSPFAVAVVQRLATPGVEINKLFRLVRDDVMEATAGRQEPYTYGSLPGKEDFFFVAK